MGACLKINDISYFILFFKVSWKGVIFFLFPFVHGMKFYQLLYCFLSFYLEGVYDTHTGKHKYACTSTQEALSLGFQERTCICLLLCDMLVYHKV